jgi:glycosyltransferase involved in cell wall biosynthesis
MGDADVPFIADFLSTLLFLAVVFVFFYSFWLTSPESRPAPAPEPDLGPLEFYIEPSPVPGQKIPYPVFAHTDPELDYSVVILVQNLASEITALLQSIQVYFANRPSLTYESLVIDLCSSDGTRDTALAFADEDAHVRVLYINRDLAASLACRIGVRRTRGRFIFLLNPRDQISIQSLDRYLLKAERVLSHDDRVLVIGSWVFENEDGEILRSTLNRVLEYATGTLLTWAHLKSSGCRHSRTLFFTRTAAKLLYANMRLQVAPYDIELIVTALTSRMRVKIAKLEDRDPFRYTTSSLERIDQVAAVLLSLFFHGLRLDEFRWMSYLSERAARFGLFKPMEVEQDFPVI